MVSSANADEQSQRHMMHEIWDTISKVTTNQLTALGKSTARSGQENNEADSGSRIITLAGENKGATMKANLEEMMDTCGSLYDDENLMTAYTNSNYQAITNSILVGGSYAAEDPGVHLVISDYYVGEHGDGDQESHWKKKDKKEKKAKKDKDKEEKKKKKGWSKGEKHSEDDETSEDSG